MCLTLTSTVPPSEKALVYKFYKVGEFWGGGFYFYSPFRNVETPIKNKGDVVISDRVSAHLAPHEIEDREVYHGLHAFIGLAGIRAFETFAWSSKLAVVLMEADPKDFVARGYYDGWDSVVYHRLTVVGIQVYQKGVLLHNHPVSIPYPESHTPPPRFYKLCA